MPGRNASQLLQGVGLEEARRIARTVSERGGGLPAVEAMALPHGEGAASRAGGLFL